MDESGRKIFIGILLAIVVSVSVYFLTFNTAALPSGGAVQGQNTEGSDSGRPAGDGALSPEASAVSRAMMGVWRSGDDPKLTREFREDGVVIDRHEGDASATKKGIWGAFTADMAPAGSAAGLTSGVVYVQMTFKDASLYFVVSRAADTLELVSLDGGEQSNFTRVR